MDDLVDAAMRLIEREEPLTTRAIATEIGASTQILYTHFTGLDQIRAAVRSRRCHQLVDELGNRADTPDAVADLLGLSCAYAVTAVAQPALYRLTFLEAPLEATEANAVLEPFTQIVNRCMADSRFTPADAVGISRQLWAITNGIVFLASAVARLAQPYWSDLAATITSLYVGYGDDPTAARSSVTRALHEARGQLDGQGGCAVPR